jgi:hypothetical protein
MYGALEEKGRRGVIRSLKDGISGGPPGAPSGAESR